ncbi:rhodanese-like domain-containing protein [Candidatus Woesearchaeota archaeon]|nr:rhodanese-like domain-containing protein [Candidatus Woesearchaeota archaeon]
MQTSLTVDDVCDLLQRQAQIVLLDVREPAEWAEARIDAATLIPISKLVEDLPKLGLPKDQQVICICRSGRRSGLAAEFLRSQGYQAANMEGGLRQWFIHKHTEGAIDDKEFKRVAAFLGPQ